MNRKIVFITSYPDVRITKRINEFKLNGYDVSAYSFVRKNISLNNWPVNVEKLQEINQSYIKRIIPFIRGFLYIRKKEKHNNKLLLYYLGLDVAIIGCLINRNKYIFEEADLTHTDTENFLFKSFFEFLNKIIIRKSFWTVFTSGGFIDFHFNNSIKPNNISVISNKLDIRNIDYKIDKKIIKNLNELKIGFVGFIRYASIINFAKIFAVNFPEMELHFYGLTVPGTDINSLQNISNIYFHGEFKSPEDLPEIYRSIDLLLATYDVKYDNVRYAEPNKLYEAIYYQTPIIVSKGTFLSNKVSDLGVGYCLDAMNNQEITNFIQSLNLKDINEKIENCRKINLADIVNDNTLLFEQLKSKFCFEDFGVSINSSQN